MAAKKTERLLNLVICLLHTRRFLSVHQIRELVPGYESDNEDAFRRMFERDKEELRDLGIPLETGTDSHAHDDELGYRIARRDYELPEITLEPDEAAALGLAARLWQSAPLAGATGSALLKLQAAGIDVQPLSGALEPRVTASEPTFEAAFAAARDRQPVRFRYRTGGRAEPQEREVEPWGVVSWHGRWYLVGFDRGRQAERVFRLSRVEGDLVTTGPAGSVDVPPDRNLSVMVATQDRDAPVTGTAQLRVRADTCWSLRSQATTTTAGEGWDLLEVGFHDTERFAQRLAGFGADVVVEGPADVRDAIVRRLEQSVGAPA